MWLMCKSCHEPRDAWDTECKKCGAALPRVVPCSMCDGKGYLQGLDGAEDCPNCEGVGGRHEG